LQPVSTYLNKADSNAADKELQSFGTLVMDAYSRAKLPLIPGESCHPFHGKVATHTRAKLPP